MCKELAFVRKEFKACKEMYVILEFMACKEFGVPAELKVCMAGSFCSSGIERLSLDS